jgi:hypothetical protein
MLNRMLVNVNVGADNCRLPIINLEIRKMEDGRLVICNGVV